MNTLAFSVFPYLALTLFVAGHILRYRSDPLDWNARSSEMLHKSSLPYAVHLFHWGVILTLLGHAGGLLIPQWVYDAFGIGEQAHTRIAYYAGLVVGNPAFIGAVLLLYRRTVHARVRVTGRVTDFVALGLLVLTTGTGLYNVFFGHYDVLYSVAPWLRGILTLSPDPSLMAPVPLNYKIHILSAFALFAFWPFSRLVHVWSLPLTYLGRRPVVFRRRPVRT